MTRVIFGLRVAVCVFVVAATGCGDDNNVAVCGNGILEQGEECDTRIQQGHNGACPFNPTADCNDGNPCTADTISGGGTCQAKCSHATINQIIPNDGCCVSQDPTREPECAGCGDGVVNPSQGEVCDTGIPAGQAGHCPTANDCPSTQCKKLVGTMCAAHCEDITMASGTTLDGCCPPGANSTTDSDCSAVCGNGLVEAGETCDTGIPSGAGACPTLADCNDNQVCTADSIQGTNCQAHCVNTAITTCSGNLSDGCCASGCNHNTDIDCSATCGNGTVEAGETCDTAIVSGTGKCPTLADCDDSIACTTDTLISGGTCNATCSHVPVTAVGLADGCCPPAGNANNDPDCAAICGNGVLESGEQCDTAIPAGTPGHCPASAGDCNDNNVCTADSVTGTACTAQCVHTPLAPNATIRDGCCPTGANANTDADCLAVCGNGVVEASGGEFCDTAIAAGQPGACVTMVSQCDDGEPCTADSIAGSGCSTHCVHTPILPSGAAMDGCCPAGANHNNDVDCAVVCGNGVVEAGENCDTAITSGAGRCPTNAATDCNDNNVCTLDTITGTNCLAQCVHTAIQPNPTTPDGCCPPGANSTTDADCLPACGNGVFEPAAGELCDTAIPAGQPGACPVNAATDCNDSDPCTADSIQGLGCNKHCVHTPIGPSGAVMDGCCPAGANHNTDVDCSASCGNGVVEAGEACDTAIPLGSPGHCPTDPVRDCNDGIACTLDAIAQPGGCSAVCTHTPITTPSGATSDGCCPPGATIANDVDCPARCGDAVVTAPETCDSGILSPNPGFCFTMASQCPTVACNTPSLTGSPSTCNVQCVYAEVACSGSSTDGCCPSACNGNNDIDCARCGNGIVELGETCDSGAGSPTPCPTNPATDCNDGDPCTVDTIDNLGTCLATCRHTTITATSLTTPDGCCPAGATRCTDIDCATVCGDSCISGSETCDNGIAVPNPGSCQNCPPVACEVVMQMGSAATCNITCPSAPVVCNATSDGCCTSRQQTINGCNGTNDIDCAVCGNNIVELGETCDGAFVATNAHTSLTPAGTTCPTTDGDCNTFITANPPLFPDGSACYAGSVSGGACNETCTFSELGISGTTSDGCCPASLGANETNDIDCPATCGNSLVANGGRELCDTGIAAPAAGHCPTFLECRVQTTNACTPIARVGSGCQQQCQMQPAITTRGTPEIDCAVPNANPPTNCLLPPVVCNPNPATCARNFPACGGNCCCDANPLPPCCTKVDGCCPALGTDSFLFDFTCVDPNASPPTNCGAAGQPRCCSPPTIPSNGDQDCYCGDPNNPAPGSGQHGEACEDAVGNHNNFDGCTDSCTVAVACTSATACMPNLNAGTGTPGTGIPCLGGSGLFPGLDISYCQTGTTSLVCATERIDARFPGGYCTKGCSNGTCTPGITAPPPPTPTLCQTVNGGGSDPCPAGNVCVNSGANSFACVRACANEFSCRYNEGYHCAPLPNGVVTPFCSSSSPAGCVSYAIDPTCGTGASPPCCVCTGCANICGDGTVQTATAEQCDLGAAFLDGTNFVPENYAAGNCTTSCTTRTHWIGDPCHVGSEAADCATLASQVTAARTHCLVYDPSMPPSLTGNDTKFRTRYDVYSNGSGGFANNGYCSTDCSLTTQDCPTLPVGPGITFRGVCLPGEGQNPLAGRGVCVFGCLSNTQCRFKEGYRCWPIANLLGLPATFLSEGPRACINPGTPTSFQGP